MKYRASIRARNVMRIYPCVFHGSNLTLLRFFLAFVLGLLCALRTVRLDSGIETSTRKRTIADELRRHEGMRLQEDGANVPYCFGNVLLHQAIRRLALPSYMAKIQSCFVMATFRETLGGQQFRAAISEPDPLLSAGIMVILALAMPNRYLL